MEDARAAVMHWDPTPTPPEVDETLLIPVGTPRPPPSSATEVDDLMPVVKEETAECVIEEVVEEVIVEPEPIPTPVPPPVESPPSELLQQQQEEQEESTEAMKEEKEEAGVVVPPFTASRSGRPFSLSLSTYLCLPLSTFHVVPSLVLIQPNLIQPNKVSSSYDKRLTQLTLSPSHKQPKN